MSSRRWITSFGAALLSLTVVGPTAAAAPALPALGPASAAEQASGGRQPIMIVLDTSGSMNDNDGTGTIKIAGASEALVELVRGLPVTTDLGLWTYPSTQSGCSTGQLRVPIGPLDPTGTSARVRSLAAGGDTPTAEALRAAVQHLKDSGYSSGTVLLVSDGESTCADPCEAAAALDDDGFDVTVQAMGFQLSAQGAKELTCVANATGGTYRDVSDGAALLADLVDAASPDIRLHVDAPAAVPPATTGAITATVTNTSLNDAHDLTVSLTVAGPTLIGNAGQGRDTAIPAVLTPILRLGNLPAGESTTRTWTFSSGLPQPLPRTVSWKVIATGRDLVAASQSGELTLTGKPLTAADAGPWLRDLIDAGGRAVIFGDSYSAGEGAKTYFDEANTPTNRCHRSPLTYAMSLFPATTQPDVLACSGAVIANLYVDKESESKEDAQLAKLADLAYGPDVAFMTMGGNDIQFADIIATCFMKIDCAKALVQNPFWGSQPDRPTMGLPEYTELLIAATQKRLVIAYETIATALNTSGKKRATAGQASQLVILPYPAILPPDDRKACAWMNGSEIAFGNRILGLLNDAVAAAVAQAVKDGYPVHVVEPAIGVMQPNHTACDKQPWVNPLDADTAITGVATWSVKEKELMHPNADGYAATTQAIIAWSQSTAPLPYAPTTTANRTWSEGTDPSADLKLVETTPTGFPWDLRASDTVTASADGYAPESKVMLTTYSIPQPLGEFSTDTSGHLDAVVTLPPDLPPGKHLILAVGHDTSGETLTRLIGVDIAAGLPWTARSLPGVAALLAVAGVSLLVIGIRRRHRPTPADNPEPATD